MYSGDLYTALFSVCAKWNLTMVNTIWQKHSQTKKSGRYPEFGGLPLLGDPYSINSILFQCGRLRPLYRMNQLLAVSIIGGSTVSSVLYCIFCMHVPTWHPCT